MNTALTALLFVANHSRRRTRSHSARLTKKNRESLHPEIQARIAKRAQETYNRLRAQGN